MEASQLLVASTIVCFIPWLNKAFFSPPESTQEITVRDTRYPFFDVIKGIAIIAVIIIHALYFFLLYQQHNNLTFLLISNNISRFAIPLFLIASGVLLTLKDYSYTELKSFYLKKVLRIFVPYFFIALIIGIYQHLPLGELAWGIVSGSLLVPYYFVCVLLQLYILYPFLKKLEHSRTALISIFIFSLICAVFGPLWYLWGIPFCGQYLFFFFYGMYYRNSFLQNTSSKNNTKQWHTMIALYLVLSLIYFGYYYNVRLIYGVAVFNLLFIYRDLLFKNYIKKILESVGRYSLWIFLIHYFIEYEIYILLKALHLPYFVLLVLTILMTGAVSYACAWVLHTTYTKIVVLAQKSFS